MISQSWGQQLTRFLMADLYACVIFEIWILRWNLVAIAAQMRSYQDLLPQQVRKDLNILQLKISCHCAGEVKGLKLVQRIYAVPYPAVMVLMWFGKNLGCCYSLISHISVFSGGICCFGRKCSSHLSKLGMCETIRLAN